MNETRNRRLLIVGGVAILVVAGALWLRRSQPVPPRATLAPGVVTVGQTPPPPAEVPAAWAKARAEVARVMKTNPERLSAHASVEPFDQSSFEHDPEAYLSKIVPGRCFQTAKPGPDVVPLDVGSPLRTEVTTGAFTILWVKTVPNAPVTYTVFGGGYFTENGVGTVSVRADARGLAGVHYTADPGINGDISVIAGSPLAAGTQRFYVHINETQPPAR